MAYNFFPNYQYPMYQNMQNQNASFVSVRSEDEARNYPVAPGNSVTFRNETEPYIYTKTMGISQFDNPSFVKYKLVKEEPANQPSEPAEDKLAGYVTKTEFEAVLTRISALENKRAKKDE